YLEELVARIGLQHVDQRLVGVTALRQSGARDDVCDLLPQQRNLERIGAVRHRREQAEETMLAEDIALHIEALDTNVIEVSWAVHGGTRCRFGHHQKLR